MIKNYRNISSIENIIRLFRLNPHEYYFQIVLRYLPKLRWSGRHIKTETVLTSWGLGLRVGFGPRDFRRGVAAGNAAEREAFADIPGALVKVGID
jgi:hypothetical protein